jgi:hypothetical protein
VRYFALEELIYSQMPQYVTLLQTFVITAVGIDVAAVAAVVVADLHCTFNRTYI